MGPSFYNGLSLDEDSVFHHISNEMYHLLFVPPLKSLSAIYPPPLLSPCYSCSYSGNFLGPPEAALTRGILGVVGFCPTIAGEAQDSLGKGGSADLGVLVALEQ
jgi:hypothetical protein